MYKQLVKSLQISDEYLRERWETVLERLLSASDIIKNAKHPRQSIKTDFFMQPADIFGINQCLHLSATVLLLGSTSEALNKTLRGIERDEEFMGQDSTTVVTVAVLYYLLLRIESDPEINKEEKDKVKEIRARFDELNWMINPRGVRALAIEKVKR